VYQLRTYKKAGGLPPQEPKNVLVPEGLDPMSMKSEMPL